MKKLNIVNEGSLAKSLYTTKDCLKKITSSLTDLYIIDTKPKKDGGIRYLTKPKYSLKTIQKNIKKLLSKIPLPLSVHGWVKGKSVKTATQIHAGKKYLYAFDIKAYFDSIHNVHVYKLFNKDLNCSPRVSRILTLLSTYNYCLPQGSPCSPVIANLILRNFDLEIENYVKKRNAWYSRLGDDIIISSNNMLIDVKKVIVTSLRKRGLKTNIDKQIINARPNKTGENILGVIIGKSVSVTRKYRRIVRAILHNARRTGLEAQNIEGRFNYRQHLQGRISLIKMYNYQEGLRLEQELRKIPNSL